MVRLFSVKGHVVSGFNALRAVILMLRTGMAVEKRKFSKDSELQALLAEDLCQTQVELAELLGLTQQAISKRLKAMGMIQNDRIGRGFYIAL